MSDTAPPLEMDGYNAGDPAQVQGRQRKVRREQAEADAALMQLLRTPQGRRWMWQHLVACGVFASSFRDNALSMAFAEGRRDVGLRLLADVMRVAPDEYLTMAEENKAPS